MQPLPNYFDTLVVTCHFSGRYVSHWRLYDTETKTLFGSAIWCSVIVTSEPATTTEQSTATTLEQSAGVNVEPLAGNSGVDVGLSTKDLFAFVKTLEMTAAKKPGALAVPTNTPLG